MPLPIVRANLSSPALPSGGGGPNLTGLLSTFLRGGSTTFVDPNKSRKLAAQAITAEQKNQPITEQVANPQNLTANQVKNLVAAQQATGDNTITGGLSPEVFNQQQKNQALLGGIPAFLKTVSNNRIEGTDPHAIASQALASRQTFLLNKARETDNAEFVNLAKGLAIKPVNVGAGVVNLTLDGTVVSTIRTFTKNQQGAIGKLVKIGRVVNQSRVILNAIKDPRVIKLLSNNVFAGKVKNAILKGDTNFIDALFKNTDSLIIEIIGGGDTNIRVVKDSVRKVLVAITDIRTSLVSDKEASARSSLELFNALTANVPAQGDSLNTFRAKIANLLGKQSSNLLSALSVFSQGGRGDIQPFFVQGRFNDNFGKNLISGIRSKSIKKQATTLVKSFSDLLKPVDIEQAMNKAVKDFGGDKK